MMDSLGKYPDDPTQKFLGENNTVSVLGQEAGHRWLVFLEFRDRTGQRSDALLGRDQAHWSFFFDSDASVMEGNDIEDLGGGSFRTVGAVQRYSLLDQYAMGLDPGHRGPAVLLRRESDQRAACAHQRIGAARRRDVQRHAPGRPHPGHRRDPRAARAFGRRLRQGAPPGVHLPGERRQDGGLRDRLAKVDRIRKAWEAFFLQATDGRMTAITTLQLNACASQP